MRYVKMQTRISINVFLLLLTVYAFYRTNGEIACSDNCLPILDPNTTTCNLTTGACLNGCTIGYTGDICDISCGDNCLNCTALSSGVNVVCHRCQDAYYKKNGACASCGSKCLTSSNSSVPVCSESDGTCMFGCVSNYFGSLCNKPCSAACTDTECHTVTGACIKGCSTHYLTGDQCATPCNAGCYLNTCEQSGVCKQGCWKQTWGPSCNTTCSFGCINSAESGDQQQCGVADGSCLYGCINGTWGSSCEKPCPENCASGSCSRTGDCLQGCVSGNWGPRCEFQCAEFCQSNACIQHSGDCTHGCTSDNVYGTHCNFTCDIRCRNSSCERIGGLCKGCSAGFHGDGCNHSCHVNCLENKCDDVFGNCTLGCVDGWRGMSCNRTCGTYCVDNVCNWIDGTCECFEDVAGPLCINQTKGIVEDNSGEDSPDVSSLVFIIIGLLVLVIFIIFSLYLVRRKL